MREPPRERGRGVLDRIVTRLSIASVVAGILAAAIGALLVGTQARDTLRDEAISSNVSQADTLARRIDVRIESLRGVLLVAARQPEITEMGDGADEALRSLLATATAFDEVILVDADGDPVAAAATRFLARIDEYQPLPRTVESVAGGSHVALIDRYPPALEVGVPVEFPPGNVRGALVARGPLEIVASPLEQADEPDEATGLLIDESGKIVVHPSRDLVAEGARFPDVTFLDQPPRQAVVTMDGENWLVGAARVTDFPGWVVVQEPEAVALAPVKSQLITLILIVIGVTTATVVALVLAGRRQLKPLRPITSAIEKLGAGERGVHLDVPAEGELRTLADRVNSMAESLDRRHDEQASLYQLSLMVTSVADRNSVQREVVQGAKDLLMADMAALYRIDDGAPTLELAHGSYRDQLSLKSLADSATRRDSPQVRTLSDGATGLAVSVRGLEDNALCTLLVVKDDGQPAQQEEVRLLETFASFAGVALENVHRLELERALVDELEQAVHSRQDLIRNVTHDLRVPIASISGFVERLRDELSDTGSSRGDGLLAALETQARELDDMVSKILEFSTPQTGRRPLTIAPTPLRAPLKAALESLESMIAARPIEISVPNVAVMADHLALTRTLTHLLSNAVKYSPAGSPIQVRAADKGEMVRVEVVDHGKGIDSSLIPRLFEPFWRMADRDESRPGTGLGLTLAAEYVRSMEGVIGVDSIPGRGATFYFTVPKAHVDRDVAAAL